MPWRIDKVNGKYKLYNLDKKLYVNVNFKTRKSASNAKKNYENYYKPKVIYDKRKK